MADDAPPPGYASDPTLTLLWGPPPAFTGNTGAASSTAASAPPHNPFSVALGTIQAAEQSMLGAAKAVIDTYNPLEQQVQQVVHDGAFFGQQATYWGIHISDIQSNNGGNHHPGTGADQSREFTAADWQLQQAAVKFAASIDPGMTRVLRMVADSTEAIGVFIALLDKAGQAYSAADKNSFFPVPQTGTPS